MGWARRRLGRARVTSTDEDLRRGFELKAVELDDEAMDTGRLLDGLDGCVRSSPRRRSYARKSQFTDEQITRAQREPVPAPSRHR